MQPFAPEALDRNFDIQPLVKSGITLIQREPLSLTGRDVVLGFVDTGIDYRNPVFRRADGSTRILAIWDQSVQTGTPPDGYFYGSEYTREQINEALQAEDPLELVPSVDEIGHGTGNGFRCGGKRLERRPGFPGGGSGCGYRGSETEAGETVFAGYYMTPMTCLPMKQMISCWGQIYIFVRSF